MKHALIRYLAKCDLADLLALSHRSMACKDYSDLKSMVLSLGNLFPFENAVCAQGNLIECINPDEHPPDFKVCDISYPESYLDLYFSNQYFYSDAVLFEFFNNLSPVNWLSVDKKCGFNYPASVMALDFNMHDGWTHGTLDVETMECTAFFFGGPRTDRNIRTAKILEYIIPFLSRAYARVINKNSRVPIRLTARETEVLNWIKAGKSSWEISLILNLSKRTIEFHIDNIKKKLQAVSRAQAVAIGLAHGLIEF